jgi:hypothetical protein
MKLWKVRIHFISKEVFQFSLITYLILLLAETIKQGLVSFFFNLNILLIVVLFSGVVMVLTHNEKLDEVLKTEEKHKIKTSDVEYIIILAAGGALLVWYKTQDLGILSIIISVLTAIIIVLLSLLVLTDKQ